MNRPYYVTSQGKSEWQSFFHHHSIYNSVSLKASLSLSLSQLVCVEKGDSPGIIYRVAMPFYPPFLSFFHSFFLSVFLSFFRFFVLSLNEILVVRIYVSPHRSVLTCCYFFQGEESVFRGQGKSGMAKCYRGKSSELAKKKRFRQHTCLNE